MSLYFKRYWPPSSSKEINGIYNNLIPLKSTSIDMWIQSLTDSIYAPKCDNIIHAN